jgi:xanthine dehydrogenase accessory factor
MKLALARQLNAYVNARLACVLITNLTNHSQELLTLSAFSGHKLRAFTKNNASQNLEFEGESYFLRFFLPPLNMVITGAVHISQSLLPLARSIGFEPLIIDPRTAFATPERFPHVSLIAEWPKTYPLDRFTAFIALTHDPKIDDPALIAALHANCFYIGALGSRKTHAARIERLKIQGFNETDFAKIKAPIGLDIGAISPQEIAIAIIAEVLEARLALNNQSA